MQIAFHGIKCGAKEKPPTVLSGVLHSFLYPDVEFSFAAGMKTFAQ